MAAASFKTYPALLEVLQETKKETIGVYTRLKTFLVHFNGNIDDLVNQLHQFTCEYLPKTDKRAIPCKFTPSTPFDPSGQLSELGKAFNNLASTTIVPIPSLSLTSSLIKDTAITRIDEDCKEYDQKFTEILDNFKQTLKSYSDTRTKYDNDYKSYVQAGDTVKAKGSNNKKLLDAFFKAKKTALDSHLQLENITAETSMKMEQILTEYEDLELWRAERMQQFLTTLCDIFNKISQKVLEGKTELYSAVHHIPIQNDANMLTDFNFIPPAEADNKYQTICINTVITHVLKPEQLYPDDIKEHRPIFKVTRDYDGPRLHLHVKSGDLIVGLSEEGDFYRCKDVNECIALVPKSILERVN